MTACCAHAAPWRCFPANPLAPSSEQNFFSIGLLVGRMSGVPPLPEWYETSLTDIERVTKWAALSDADRKQLQQAVSAAVQLAGTMAQASLFPQAVTQKEAEKLVDLTAVKAYVQADPELDALLKKQLALASCGPTYARDVFETLGVNPNSAESGETALTRVRYETGH